MEPPRDCSPDRHGWCELGILLPRCCNSFGRGDPKSSKECSKGAYWHSVRGHDHGFPNLDRHTILSSRRHFHHLDPDSGAISRIVQPGLSRQPFCRDRLAESLAHFHCWILLGIHTWQSRLAWSFARDHGLPLSKWIGHISPPPYDVPLYAHAWSTFWVGVLGCLYLGSSVAFNSFVGGAIILQYLTYSICIVLLLVHGRENFHHGPFWLKRLGPVANYATIGWTIVTTVFYCFPPYLPVQVDSMNYVSVVIMGIFSIVALWYVLRARKVYTAPLNME